MDTDNNQKKRSPLESLEEKLYQPGAGVGERPKAPEVFSPREDALQKTETKWTEEEGEQQYMTIKKYQKRKIITRLIVAFSVLMLAGAGYLGYVYFFQTFKKSDVSVKITGPETVESGENIEFTVSYQNRSDFDLENAVLLFEWPEGAIPKDSTILKNEQRLGTISSGRAKGFTYEGQFFGAKNNKMVVNATLQYSPKGVERSYEAKSVFESLISKTPFSVIMNIPPRAVSGNEVELILEYQNLSQTSFDDMQLKIEYPEGFIFSSAEPAASFSNNVWEFEKINGKENGKIKLKGILSGRENENKLFQAFIGKLNQDNELIAYAGDEETTVMSSTILFVYQTVNDGRDIVASPRDRLSYKIKYRNTSDVAIPNVTITAKIDSKAVDYRSFDIRWGSFSGAINSIVWNSTSVPQLSILGPGEEGEVLFSVRLKDKIEVAGFSDQNFIVSNIVSVNSDQIPDVLRGIPIGNEDKVDVRVNTVVDFAMKGLYKNAPLENSGPIPPRIGQKTTYNIIWQLTNTTNDIDGAKIEAALPPNVAWEGRVSPGSADIVYDKFSGKVVWNIGKIPIGTGFIMPAMQAAFQVSITPGLADVGRSVDLISSAKFGGIDSFTNTSLASEEDKKNIYLQEDSYIMDFDGGYVAQ